MAVTEGAIESMKAMILNGEFLPTRVSSSTYIVTMPRCTSWIAIVSGVETWLRARIEADHFPVAVGQDHG